MTYAEYINQSSERLLAREKLVDEVLSTLQEDNISLSSDELKVCQSYVTELLMAIITHKTFLSLVCGKYVGELDKIGLDTLP